MNPAPVDPLSPDAPLHHLLSVRHNPLVAKMSQDELLALVRKLKQNATSPPTLTAKLRSESATIKPSRGISSKRKALLDSI